jgi:Fe-S-cluster containining protein
LNSHEANQRTPAEDRPHESEIGEIMFLESPPPHEKRLQPTDTFHFSCHRELSCFNTCCRNKHLPLTPYDILRIKRNLAIHSDDFLARYVVYRPDPESGFPILSIKMRHKEAICPFVTEKGCAIYPDRPTACRLYPLGRSSGIDSAEGKPKEFYALLHITQCHGLREEKAWSVAQWVNDQGLLPYIHMNDKMLEILFHPRRNPSTPINGSPTAKSNGGLLQSGPFPGIRLQHPVFKTVRD